MCGPRAALGRRGVAAQALRPLDRTRRRRRAHTPSYGAALPETERLAGMIVYATVFAVSYGCAPRACGALHSGWLGGTCAPPPCPRAAQSAAGRAEMVRCMCRIRCCAR